MNFEGRGRGKRAKHLRKFSVWSIKIGPRPWGAIDNVPKVLLLGLRIVLNEVVQFP